VSLNRLRLPKSARIRPPGRAMPPQTDPTAEAITPLPQQVGKLQVWWIPNPGTARLSMTFACWAWLAAAATLAATGFWAWRTAWPRPFWPWSAYEPTLPQQLLKYLLVLAVFLAYATAVSAPAWWRCARQLPTQMEHIRLQIEQRRWLAAAAGLHRLGLMRLALGLRPPAQARQWNDLLRPLLPPGPRLYLYYRDQPPPLPHPPSTSFRPLDHRLSPPLWWGLLALAALALLGYPMVASILHAGQWLRLASIDFALLVALLIGYGTFYLARALGRARYLRIRPHLLELVQYGIRGRQLTLDRYPTDQTDVVFDLSGRRVALGILPRQTTSTRTWLSLPRNPQLIQAILQAALCGATTPHASDGSESGRDGAEAADGLSPPPRIP
jgi:hypothetical protein